MKHLILFIFAACISAAAIPANAQTIKNEQSILGGELMRAGNSDRAQLSDSELTSLCEKGFTSAYFLYSGANARVIHCSRGTIAYRSQSVSNVQPILEDVYRGIKGTAGKTFVHCYNGAHASGMIAAFALKQFCGESSAQAFDYWSSHLGGYPLQAPNMAAVRRRIETFQTSNSLELSDAERAQVCP